MTGSTLIHTVLQLKKSKYAMATTYALPVNHKEMRCGASENPMNRKNFHDSVVIERPTTANVSPFRTPRAEWMRPWD